MTDPTNPPLRIFISYAHIDEAHKDRLASHLAVLRRKKLVDVWHDRQIDGGADWRGEIRAAMDDCSVGLLLVSDAFLNSEFIQSQEMEHLWQRRKADGIRLAPIIVRPCPWKLDDKLGALQAMPADDKALITFSTDNGARDQAWTDIAYMIAEWAKEGIAAKDAAAKTQGQAGPIAVNAAPTGAEPAAPPAADTTEPPAAPPAAAAGDWRGLLMGPLRLAGRLLAGAKGEAKAEIPALPPMPDAMPFEAVQLVPAAVNPFDPWDEAVPPRFVGRADVLLCLRKALDEKRSVSLVGDWRIGKTSILRTWQMSAEQAGRVVCFLSGEGPEAVSCAAFVSAVSGQPAPKDIDANDADGAADRLVAWTVSASPAGLPPLILIDEADRLLTRLPARFFERLRGMLDRVCLVFASRQEVDRIYASDGRTSPFVNRLEMRRIGLLDDAAAEALIAQGGDVLTDEDRDLMRTWAGRHPYYLALLGRHLWDARLENGDAAGALELFRDEAGARLRELWRALSDKHRQQLAGGGKVDDELMRRGLAVAEQAFGKVMTEWLNENQHP